MIGILVILLLLMVVTVIYKNSQKIEKFTQKRVRFNRNVCNLETKEVCGSIPGIIDRPQVSYLPRNFMKF